MLVAIRVVQNGQSRNLCELDLMKFSETQIRQRMFERGIIDDDFYICGITDWNVDRIMSLREAYILKAHILELYDGDDYLIRFMLKSGLPLSQIFSNYYKFFSKDELVVMQHLLNHAEPLGLLEAFYRAGNWANFIMGYVKAGYMLHTPRGFYLQSDFFEVKTA